MNEIELVGVYDSFIFTPFTAELNGEIVYPDSVEINISPVSKQFRRMNLNLAVIN